MARGAKLNRWLEYIVVIICFIAPMLVAIPWAKLDQSNDFAQCYAASYVMHNNSFSQIYNSSFSVPPVISWFFSPLAWLKCKTALYAFIAVGTGLMLLSCLALCQAMGIRGGKRLWTVAAFGALGPCIMAIWHEQLTPILLFALVGLFVSLKKKRYLSATAYQFLLWLKPYLLLPLIMSEIGAGQTNLVIISLLLAVIGVLLSCVVGGVGILESYWHVFTTNKIETSFLSLFQAFAIPNPILRIGLPIHLYSLFSVLLYLAVLVVAFFVGKQIKAKQLRVSILLTFLIPLVVCLFSGAMAYDLLLLTPAIFLIAITKTEGWLKYLKILVMTGIIGVLILPSYLLIFSMGIFRSGIFSPFFWSALIFTGFAFIIEKHNSGSDGSAA